MALDTMTGDALGPLVLGLVSLALLGSLASGAVLAGAGRTGAPADSGAPRGAWTAPAVGGGFLLALVAGDLLPSALNEAAESRLPGVAIGAVAVGALALGGVLLWRRSDPVSCCAPNIGRVAGLALAGHGLLEGLVVGLGLGVGDGLGLGLLALVLGHRVAEGFALGTALRSARTGGDEPVELRGERRFVAAVALAPLLGAGGGLAVTPAAWVDTVLTALLAGLVAAVAVRLLAMGARRALRDATSRTTVVAS